VKHYIALGDSISIDDYPLRETGVDHLGAASLFHRNNDARWPEFRGRDLVTQFPGITFQNLTADGATSDDVLRYELAHVDRSAAETIVTITAGGNDMLMNLRAARPPANLVDGMIDRIDRIIAEVSKRLPHASIIVGTVYDPSDGTNVLYGDRLDREAAWLARYNDAVRKLARGRVQLADIHKHFLGHGLTVPERDRWYWSGLIFEPNARGASEVRRLWWENLSSRA
jgi:lysophospholipase L1-like esterase